MVKRTRAASVASTSQADSILSTSSNGDIEYNEVADNARPATRRRTNNTRSKLASTTSSGSVSADIAVGLSPSPALPVLCPAPPQSLADILLPRQSPSPSSSIADDPKSARKQQRKERNRISAQHSRDRKRFESQELRGRLEEAETRVSALAADNERLREENSRFKLELEKSSSLQGELSSLKERFEMLERLLLAGSQSSLTSSAVNTAASLATPTTLPHPSQSPISAPVHADSRIGSETHATGMHSLFRSTTSLDSCSGMTELRQDRDSRQGMSRSSNNNNTQGSSMSSLPPSLTTARSTTSFTTTATAALQPHQQRHSVSLPSRKTPSTRPLKTFFQIQAEACLPTSRLSLRDKQRLLLRRQQRQQASQPRHAHLRADLLARAKIITMTMIDSMSNNRRN